jgi:hypothetical protein
MLLQTDCRWQVKSVCVTAHRYPGKERPLPCKHYYVTA